MVFWYLHAESGLSYEQTPLHPFHISAAVLDPKSVQDDKITSVVVETNGESSCICNLSHKHNILQVPLDLKFDEGENFKIFVQGSSAAVYLSGYTLDKQKRTQRGAKFNGIESDDEVSKRKKKRLEHNSKSNVLTSPACSQDNLSLQKTKSQKSSSLSQKVEMEQKLTRKEKKLKELQGASAKKDSMSSQDTKQSSVKKGSDINLADLIVVNVASDDEEDEEYTLEEEESSEEEEEEEEDEEMEEEEEEGEVEGDNQEEEEEEEEEKADNDDEKENDEHFEMEEVQEEEEDVFMESPPKRKRNRSPPSSAGRTPLVKWNKARKQETSPDLSDPPKRKRARNRRRSSSHGTPRENKSSESHSESDLGTPQTEIKKHIKAGGLVCEDLKIGNGPEAKVGKKISVHYVGKLKNGKVFDKTRSGDCFQFKLGAEEVIKAWDVGVLGMKVGGKRKIVAPPSMAYGKKGYPPEIPSNAFLTFEIELKAVN